jgi:hypothetical protein
VTADRERFASTSAHGMARLAAGPITTTIGGPRHRHLLDHTAVLIDRGRMPGVVARSYVPTCRERLSPR